MKPVIEKCGKLELCGCKFTINVEGKTPFKMMCEKEIGHVGPHASWWDNYCIQWVHKDNMNTILPVTNENFGGIRKECIKRLRQEMYCDAVDVIDHLVSEGI